MASCKNTAKYMIGLPNTYDTWPGIKENLIALSEKTKKGLDAFAQALEGDGPVELALLKNVLAKGEYVTQDQFCDTLIPWIAGKALQVETLFKDMDHTIPKLFAGCSKQLQLSRQQVCCLMALAFFNTFKPVVGSTVDMLGGYQHFTLSGFLSFPFYASQQGKLLCVLHYFERIRLAESNKEEQFLNANLLVTRKQIGKDDSEKFWGECSDPLVPFESISDGLIEEAHGCLQVDFANEYIGGGVLGMGNVQEEIRFVINPECLVSILFCEVMGPLESILITGAEQFSSYTGYGGRFKFTGPYNDPNPLDTHNRKQVNIIAIDAIPFGWGSNYSQYQRHGINRELYKAYCGFSHSISTDDPASEQRAPVATGNWGCGAFGGDKEMKTLLQWMAASKAGRPVRYYTFKDEAFGDEQRKITKFLLDKKITVQQLYKVLVGGKLTKNNVFSYIMEAFDN